MIAIAVLLTLVVAQAADIADVRHRALIGDAVAQADLARAYQTGSGVPRDRVEACKWFRIARAGGAVTQIERDMTSDEKADAADRADIWLHRTDPVTPADRGDTDAVRARAIAYRDGQGVKADELEALAWAVAGRVGAPERDPSAARLEQEFGGLEKKLVGREVEVLSRAWQIGKRFAANGNVHAQIWLATGYSRRNTEGARLAKEDLVESYKWFDVAVARANGAPLRVQSSARDFLEASMAPDQLAEAKQRSREWLSTFTARNPK